MKTYNIGGKRPRRTIFTQKTIINQSKCKIQSKIAAKGRSIDSKSIKNRRKSKKHRLKTGEKSVVEKSMAGTIFNSDSRVAQEACIQPYHISCHILLYIKYHIMKIPQQHELISIQENKKSLIQNVHVIFNKSNLTDNEANLLLGVLNSIKKALQK